MLLFLSNINQTIIDSFGCFFFFQLYKEYNSCLISFLSSSELFPAFNYANVFGNLLSIWSGVNIFCSCPTWFRLLKSRFLPTIFTILSCFSILISSSDIFSISFFKSTYPLLIISTKLLFTFLPSVLYKAFSIALGIWNLKSLWYNYLFLPISLLLINSLNSFILIFFVFLGGSFYQALHQFVFPLLQTHTNNHQVLILCIQFFLYHLYLNHSFFLNVFRCKHSPIHCGRTFFK